MKSYYIAFNSAKHPETWTKEEVGVWLRWCTEEYSIDPIPQHNFDLNGKALGLLSRIDFIDRVPKNGDVLYNSLKYLASKHDHLSARYLLMPSSSPSTSVANLPTNTPLFPRRPSYIPTPPHSYPSTHTQQGDGHDFFSLFSRSNSQVVITDDSPFIRPSSEPDTLRSECTDPDVDRERRVSDGSPFMGSSSAPDALRSGCTDSNVDRQRRVSDCRLLWKFIYQLLRNPKHNDIVCWEDKDRYVFRIVNPTGLAELWGQQKNRTNMTYEKLSRALRYYYRLNIIKKVPGERLTYRFLQPPKTILKGQRGSKSHYKGHILTGSNNRKGIFPGTGNSSSETITFDGMRAAEIMLDKADNHSKDSFEFEEDDSVSKDDEIDMSSIKVPVLPVPEHKLNSWQTYSSRLPLNHPPFLAHIARLQRTNFLSKASCFSGFQHSGRGFQNYDSLYHSDSQSSSFIQRRNSMPSRERDGEIKEENMSTIDSIVTPLENLSKDARFSSLPLRSSSLKFAKTFKPKSSSLRLSTSYSPEVNLHMEPEDLSIKGSPESKLVQSIESIQEIEQIEDEIFSSAKELSENK